MRIRGYAAHERILRPLQSHRTLDISPGQLEEAENKKFKGVLGLAVFTLDCRVLSKATYFLVSVLILL